MCIDYRVVNTFIKLSNYPLPLIDDLLIGFESAMWFMSLDMASGFWAIRMTERAKLISAFVCPFGHFQWVRMPFGLKNAPLVYQAVINNCLWGFVRLPPEEEAEVDRDVLDFLQLECPRGGVTEEKVLALTDTMTVFQRNIPTPSHMGPVLGRISYIDDIAHGAVSWDQLCEDLNKLLFRLRYWNISASLPKSEFGKQSIPYLSHEISAEGIRATPKLAKGVQDLPFPNTLKGVQSFLGSLNYYHKFIEDFPVVAAVLYELTDEQIRSKRDLSRAKESFEILKRKIVSTPLLRHPGRTKPFVIIQHANRWAACAVLGQEYDGVIHPVRYTGRVLNDEELRYHIAEKEAIAVLRVLQVFRTLIEGCPLEVYIRYSVLKWIIQSKTADGRCVSWGVTLSHWNLDIRKVKKDEDGLAAIMGAGITPRDHLGEVAVSLVPATGLVKAPLVISVEMLVYDFEGVMLSFDGAAKTSTRRGSCGSILWKLPGWSVMEAHGFILEDVTVNDAEYSGLLKGLQMTLVLDDSWTVQEEDERRHLEQVSKIPEQLMKSQASLGVDIRVPESLADVSFQKENVDVSSESAPLPNAARVMAAVTQSGAQREVEDSSRAPLGPSEYQAERWRRIKVHQRSEEYLAELVRFLKGDFESFSPRRLRKISKVANLFALDSRGIVYRLARSTRDRPQDFADEPRLVVPKALQADILHYAHEDYQGGHQRKTRTHERLRSEFYWPGMYADVDRFVEECVDCASEKGRPPNPGASPGNITPRRPFEAVSMDFVAHMHKSARGNTFLLLFQDIFSGYVMCKPMSSTTAQDVAEAYEERVFRSFGASSLVRHDQDPRFMSEVFTRFRELLGSRQQATLAYRPQANGQQERSVQTVIRSVRAYIAEANQSDWDDHAERLMSP
ncbi:hypothetical protein PR001_g17039 [Phytophthora rubi]|uniref:Reverse transcriptase n=1 Tax=Phytophthora rubi TaxID=129364 RepID=A0A6A3KI76_9STRA|nr:hypothetical protein PR001_g17039 [Phytophthora rubi]